MDFIIRKALNTELSAVLALVKELAVYEHAPLEVTATLSDYKADFEQNLFEVLVAIHNKDIIGMAFYYMTYSTWKGKMLYLEDLVVTENYRRMEVGQLLFNAVKEEAQNKKAKLLKWQVLNWNEPAIRFYEKNNAILEKEWWNGKIFLKGNNQG